MTCICREGNTQHLLKLKALGYLSNNYHLAVIPEQLVSYNFYSSRCCSLVIVLQPVRAGKQCDPICLNFDRLTTSLKCQQKSCPVLITDTQEECTSKLKALKGGMESKMFHVNIKWPSLWPLVLDKYPCVVCVCSGAGNNSIHCLYCMLYPQDEQWHHYATSNLCLRRCNVEDNRWRNCDWSWCRSTATC